MKLKVTLEVSDAARRQIALLRPDGRQTTRTKKAVRSVIIAYLQERLENLSKLYPWWDNEPLTPTELAEAADAVSTLRYSGKTDEQIRAWLALQRARYVLTPRDSRKPRR